MTRMAGEALAQLAPSSSEWLDAAKRSWESRAAVPGNTWILPSQGTQHRTGNPAELVWQYPFWQYPFFRQEMVDAGLLPPVPSPGNPKELRLPDGVSVLQAIEAGLIR